MKETAVRWRWVALCLLVSCQGTELTGSKRGTLVVSIAGDEQPPAVHVTHDVGGVRRGERLTVQVRATNLGPDAMIVTGASVGSSGTGSWFVRDTRRELAPEMSVEVEVTFSPATVGPQATTLTFAHDADAAFPSVSLTGTGL